MLSNNKIAEIQRIIRNIPSKEHLWISLVGEGGKDDLMKQLAACYKKNGKTVLMTTTTKIQNTKSYKWDADFEFTDKLSALSFNPENPCIVLYADSCYDIKKLKAPEAEILQILASRYDVILCESDSTLQLPFKIHTDRNPVFAPANDFVLGVFGSSGLGKPAADWCYGIDNVSCPYPVIDQRFIEWYLTIPEGLMKDTEEGKRAVIVTEDCPSEYMEVLKPAAEKTGLPIYFI